MIPEGLSIDSTSMPMELPDAAQRKIVTYTQRLAPYYSHLGKLISAELRENIAEPQRKLPLTPNMGKVFQAILLHAAHYSPNGLFDVHPQSTLMQKLIKDTFGAEYEGPRYLECLYAIGESFWDEPANLNDESKRKSSQ